jgi:heme/copper-type cytochrome/quinol oxidase subunit 3
VTLPDRPAMPPQDRVSGVPTSAYLDVADLPDIAFGARDIMWWGTLGFVVIEGFTLAICLTVYLYLWKNFTEWPPAGTERPTLLWPTVQLVAMLVSLPVIRRLSRVAKAFELDRVRVGLVVASAFIVAFAGLRWLELTALHTKWSMNAYASAAWLVVGSHATLIAVELVEIVGMTLVFWFRPVEKKHFSDVADMGFYWFFLVLSWIPVYVTCYLGPWIAS